MSMPVLEPITDDDLLEFCEFLHENLNDKISAEGFAEAFNQPWGIEKPNNGFLLRHEGQIVGGIGAIYAKQIVHGNEERFCNITGWCVLEKFRTQSMRLALAVVSQDGYHFTDLSPTAVVMGSLQFLKFKPLDERRTVIPNLPWPLYGLNGVRVFTDPDAIEQVLPPEAAKVYRDHLHFPWLEHLAVGRRGAFCYVVFKKGLLKNLPSAIVIGISDPELFGRYHRALGNHLLFKHGMVTTQVETRFLQNIPRLSTQLSGYRNKMFRSDTLEASSINNLYSELVALDL